MSTTRRYGSSELFPTDTPIGLDAMIGRRDDVTRMATALLGGTNLVVAGPRRTGKTSVCDAAVAVCAQEGAYPVAVDLFLLPEAAALAEELTVAALANRPVLRTALTRAARAAGQAWDALTDAATIRAHQDLGDAGIDLELTLLPRRAQESPAEALRTAVQLLGVIADADDRRMVVFLDEFQEIAGGRFGDPDAVTKMLRAVLQRAPSVSVVFAGSIEHMMRQLFGPSERALSQFGSFFDLGEITPEEWRDGLRERLALDGRTIADTALDRLVATGDGHPRATMLLAQHAHAIAVEELRDDLDDAIVVAALPRAMRGEALRHQQTLQQIREIGRHAQTLAQRVALGATLYEGLQPSTAARTMGRLRDAGIVEQDGPRGAWRIGDPLLRRFLADLPRLGRITI
ncbi:MAG TPA: AAA family ATPase [Capillimicrobium sp.]|nr:AAA family ATPase [Capillimicrobium sp.]